MNYSFEYIDIILLAMIAGFIILRLRGILGKRTGFEGKTPTQFENILKNGFQNIYYIKDMKIDDLDNEGTVDGVHLTDLGFLRYADYLIENFKKFKLIND